MTVLGRKKKQYWPDNLVNCKNVIDGKRCPNQTHFANWTVQSTDTLRRKRMGFCDDCWKEYKKTEAYKQQYGSDAE